MQFKSLSSHLDNRLDADNCMALMLFFYNLTLCSPIKSSQVCYVRAFTVKFLSHSVSRLARKGRTIIFSIHQPRYSIFRLCDRLSLLALGHMLYHGPAEDALEFFSSIGKIHHCAKKPLFTTVPATSKSVLFPGHNHLLTTGTDDPTL